MDLRGGIDNMGTNRSFNLQIQDVSCNKVARKVKMRRFPQFFQNRSIEPHSWVRLTRWWGGGGVEDLGLRGTQNTVCKHQAL